MQWLVKIFLKFCRVDQGDCLLQQKKHAIPQMYEAVSPESLQKLITSEEF